MAKFNVTSIRPDGFLHTSGFNEVIESLSWSLSALGHDVNVTQNWLSEQREHNIVFGAELIADFQRLPAATTLFNLEQPSHPNMDKVRKLARDSGVAVWDYSARAVEEWRAVGHARVTHCPIGWTPNLTRIPHSPTVDIDVLFYGWLTPRRLALIDELRRHGLHVVSTAACYGGGRDNLISRAKVCLNVHHDGRDRFEIVRCSYLMANSKLVVTESSADDDEYADLRNGMAVVPYRLLVDTCRSLCATPTERAALAERGFADIQRRDFTAAVAAALDATPTLTTLTPPTAAVAAAPVLSRPLEFATTRAAARRNYISEARDLKPHNNVAARYAAAQRSGDMRDFVVWLRDHARGNVVEIGVRDGASTSAFLSGVEEHGGHVYSIDVQPCGNLFAGHPQWSFLQANSTDIPRVTSFIPYEIDLLLIDGDHSQAGVIADWEYSRQVRSGGMILFHDIAPEDKPSGCTDTSWPGDGVKVVYATLCSKLPEGWSHFEIPGRFGMGVIVKPAMTPPAPITVPETPETTEAK